MNATTPLIQQLNERIAKLEDEIDYLKRELKGRPERIFRGIYLSPTQAEIMAALRFDSFVCKERIIAALGRDIDYNNLTAQLCFLRRKLATVGVGIVVQYNTGYRLIETTNGEGAEEKLKVGGAQPA